MKLAEPQIETAVHRETTAELSVEVFQTFEEVAHLQIEWDRFVVEMGGDIYFSYDWCRMWWRYYGSGRTLRVFTARIDGKLAGLLPMFIDRIRLGPIRLCAGKPVGSDFTLQVGDPPIHSDHAEAILRTVFDRLIKEFQCDLIDFPALPETSVVYRALQKIKQSPDAHFE